MPTDPRVEDFLKVDDQKKALDQLTAKVIALAQGRESATRTDYANPRFKEIRALLEGLKGGRGTGG